MLRIVFIGTPDFAVPTLKSIAAAGYEIAAVYTQPPRPAGRGMDERKSAVHSFAESIGLHVDTPRSLRGDEPQRIFERFKPDIAVVVAYGLILPKPVLDTPRHGCLNLHASALPRWRGAAPIQRAIMAGDSETAATVMRMDEGLDTGPVCLAERVPIGPDMIAGELHDVLAERGAALMVKALREIEGGRLTCAPQPVEGVTYAAKIDKAEGSIDFSRSAQDVHNHVRGLSPVPGAWFEIGAANGRPERIRVLRTEVVQGLGAPGTVLDDRLTVACGQGAVRLMRVQRAGRRPVTAEEFMRGFRLPPDARLSSNH